MNEDFPPKLSEGQRSVVFAGASTGPDKGYRVFSSEEEATAFAQFYIERHPAMECFICDENGNQIISFRNEP